MIKVLFQLVVIQIKTFFRQPEVLFWAVIFPLILFWVLGLAFDTKKEIKASVGIVQTTKSLPDSFKQLTTFTNPIQTKFATTVIFSFQTYSTEKAAIQALKRGKIVLFIQNKTNGNGLQYHFDPQNKEAQTYYLLLENLQNQQSTNEVIVLKAKGSRYIDFLLPGLLAFNMMSSCLWGIGWGLIEIRMKKYLKRLMSTPISRSVFLVSQMVTRLLISIFEIGILWAFAYFYFGVTLSGSLFAFAYLFIVGNFTFSGIAILIGSRTANSLTGNGLLNACMMPMMLTSGIFFSYHNFPKFIIPIIQYLPLTILADSIRAVFIESAHFSDIFFPSCILIFIGIFCYSIGLKIFKWY